MEQKIKAGDLRIGNLIDHSFNGIVKVKGIHPSLDKLHIDCVKEQGEGKKAWRDIKEFSPIPLTEEWLVRFGFNKHQDGWFWINWGTNGVAIVKWAHVYKKYSYELGKHKVKILDSVHQLQNLFNAITGTELTINDK